MGSEQRRIRIAIEEAERAGVLGDIGPLEVLCGAECRDDCAVLRVSPTTDLVVGSDFVRGTGFYLFSEGILTHEDIGWYLAAANISDLAAMGARPAGLVVAARYTADLSDDDWRAQFRGICSACREYCVPLLGGDSGGFAQNVLSAAAIGTVPAGRALLRSQGRPGDAIFLTGTIGAAGAAVAYFYRGRHRGVRVEPEIESCLAESWRRVRPAVAQGVWLAESGHARCALDTSDGLKAGLLEIAARSGVDVVLRADAIPIDNAARAVADAMGIATLDLAVSDSVDFRLIFTVSQVHVANVKDHFRAEGWMVSEIGYLREPRGKQPTLVQTSATGDEQVPGVAWEQSETPTVDQLWSGERNEDN